MQQARAWADAQLVVEAGSSADKKDVETEQGERLVWEHLLEEVSVSPVHSSPQLCHVGSRDHFPVCTVHVSIVESPLLHWAWRFLSDSGWPTGEIVTNPQSGHILSSNS